MVNKGQQELTRVNEWQQGEQGATRVNEGQEGGTRIHKG